MQLPIVPVCLALKNRMPHREKIAVLRYRYLGDTVITFPFLARLRKQFPSAQIDWFNSPEMLPISQLCSSIDNVIGFDPKKNGWLNSIQQLKGYDKVYILKRSLSSALMAFLAGIPKRIGFNTEGRGLLLTHKIPYQGSQQHEALNFLDLLHYQNTGHPIREEITLKPLHRFQPELTPETLTITEEIQQAKNTKAVIAIHPHSSNLAKCWPLGYFAELMTRLSTKAHFVLLGTPNEMPRTQELLSKCQNISYTNACGKTTLLETLLILAQCDGLIANDSGIPHLAALVDIPHIVLFGPTDPKQWRPLSQKALILTENQLDCRPCRLKITCNNQFNCLYDLSVNQVLEAAEGYFKKQTQ